MSRAPADKLRDLLMAQGFQTVYLMQTLGAKRTDNLYRWEAQCETREGASARLASWDTMTDCARYGILPIVWDDFYGHWVVAANKPAKEKTDVPA